MMKKRLLGLSILLFWMAGGVLYAQDITLDEAIKTSAEEIGSKLRSGVKVVVLNFRSPSVRFSDYALDEMMTELVKGGKVTVVDRANLELIQQEMQFQMSGEVSDSSAQAIGQKLGAQSIISGSIEDMGTNYRIRFRTIEVETAAIQVLTSVNVRKNSQTATLMGEKPPRNAGRTLREGSVTDDDWKHHILYFGVRLGGAPNFYKTSDDFNDFHSKLKGIHYSFADANFDWEDTYNSFGFNGAAQIALQLTDIFAIQTEFMFTQDEGEINCIIERGMSKIEEKFIYSYNSLLIPLLAKLTFRPQNISIAGFGGVYFSIPLGTMNFDYDREVYGLMDGNYTLSKEMDIETAIGFMVGGSVGLKAGPGVVFVDIRFASDFKETRFKDKEKIKAYGGNYANTDIITLESIFTRSKLPITIGYEIGLGKR